MTHSEEHTNTFSHLYSMAYLTLKTSFTATALNFTSNRLPAA